MEVEIPPRLRWAVRRGMLELDVLLGVFLEEVYLKLSAQDQVKFVQLLSCNDQELYNWLTGKEQCVYNELIPIVERIRDYAKNRHKA